MSITVLTLNLRHGADRWPERRGMLLDQFVALAPDIACLQEVDVPLGQGAWLVAEANARLKGRPPYALYQANKTGEAGRREGIAIVTRLAASGHEWLDLRGGSRVAQRLTIETGGGALRVYNTHLHNGREAAALRLAQARLILGWMADDTGPAVFAGDFNATPGSDVVACVSERMRSAYAAVHGREPDGTVPAPLNAEWGQPPKTIDYIFVSDGITVRHARIAFDAVAPHDARLSASDHYGIAVSLEA
jgi:endonuclease/exonuclease/phosphatase family metal-dependent hydrolase